MTTTRFRRPTARLLAVAIAVFSLAAIACTTTPADSTAGNDEPPNIGAPSGVVDGTGASFVDAPDISSQTVSIASREIVVGEFVVPAVEPSSPYTAPASYGAPAAYGVPALYGGQASVVGTANSGIWVTGQATLEIPADIAQVSIGIESRETTVAEARQNAAAAMDSVLAAIRAHGVADDDVVTSYFNIQPQTTWIEVADSIGRHSEPRITGYIVNNTVQVTVRDIDNLGDVVDTAATAGGDLIRINSIQFTVDDTSAFGEQIREMAAADALAKADLYARVMGVTLGPVVYLTELGNSVPMARAAPLAVMAEMDVAFARTPISAGDVNLSVSVQVVFAIVG
ncbi:MAG: SIMPL domain-containing protein [Chloroflexi bacterium]|nr:SIMPL domain-containing protein [Chloroflexota bacterium]